MEENKRWEDVGAQAIKNNEKEVGAGEWSWRVEIGWWLKNKLLILYNFL